MSRLSRDEEVEVKTEAKPEPTPKPRVKTDAALGTTKDEAEIAEAKATTAATTESRTEPPKADGEKKAEADSIKSKDEKASM